MDTAGWIIMLTSVSSVTLLFGWCLYKVLSIPHETEHLHGFEQEPPDVAREREHDAHP